MLCCPIVDYPVDYAVDYAVCYCGLCLTNEKAAVHRALSSESTNRHNGMGERTRQRRHFASTRTLHSLLVNVKSLVN